MSLLMSVKINKKILTFAAVLALAAIGLLNAACKSGYPVSAKNAPGAAETRVVKTAQVSEIPMERAVTVSGTLAAQDQATISAKVPGRVQTLAVDLGSIVHKGQVIAQLEQQDYKLRLQQAEAALQQARARVGLSPDGADEQVDPEKTATGRQARAPLDDAKLKLERTKTLPAQGLIAPAQLDAAAAACNA